MPKLNRFVLASLVMLLPISASAAKLGGMTVLSKAGEPFVAEIPYLASDKERTRLTASIAPADIYAEQGISYSPALSKLDVGLTKRDDGTPIIRLSAKQPYSPLLPDLLVQLEWPTGRSMRAYSAAKSSNK